MDFVQVAKDVGVPVAILVFGALALWRMAGWIGRQVVVPIVSTHVEFVKDFQKYLEVSSQHNQQQDSLIGEMTAMLKEEFAASREFRKRWLETQSEARGQRSN